MIIKNEVIEKILKVLAREPYMAVDYMLEKINFFDEVKLKKILSEMVEERLIQVQRRNNDDYYYIRLKKNIIIQSIIEVS